MDLRALPRPTPLRSIGAALAGAVAAGLCGWSSAGIGLPALPPTAQGLALVAMIGLLAAHGARLTATPASPAQAAWPAAVAVGLAMPGLAMLPAALLGLWRWRVERRSPFVGFPRAANDNAAIGWQVAYAPPP